MSQQKALQTILNNNSDTTSKLQSLCDYLYQEVPHYNWVGFYFADEDHQELILGPYAGASTEHTRIPFGKGICGQVAESNETFVVPDVHEADNYLACSIETQAEVVVPIFKDGKNIGQIDIDSHTKAPFSNENIQELEWLCEEVSKIL